MSEPVVIIEVHDGVVYCARKPTGVVVVFRDWDLDGEDVVVEEAFPADKAIANANSEDVVAAAKVIAQLAEIARHTELTELQVSALAECRKTFNDGFHRIPQ